MKKSNRVSWAPGPNLCQVKHFLEEDCTSKVGRGSQHHHQLKQTHPSIIRSSSEGRQFLKQSKERLSYRPLAKWKCPPKFNLNEKWRVVAGEESKDAEDQEHRETRVLEAVYPSRSAIPLNPCTSSDLDQYYDDNQTPVIRIIPIEEEADVEVSFHLTPSQTISSESADARLPNSPSSSLSIVTSQNLPVNGKSVPQSLSTFQNPRKLPSNSPFSVRCPSNVQSALPDLSRCQNLKGSEQTQVSPKPPVSYNSVPRYQLTFKNLSTPDQTEICPDQPANKTISSKSADACLPNSPSSSVSIVTYQKVPANGKSVPQSLSTFQNPRKPPSNSPFSVKWPSNVQSAPPYLSRCKNLKGSEQTQVSPEPPVSYNSVPQYRSTFKNLSTPPDRTEIFPDQPANQNHAPKYRTVCENQNIAQVKSQVSGTPPANNNPVTQFLSTCENLNIPGFEGDMTVAIAAAVVALAKSQEQGSLIDRDLLVKLLLNPDQIAKLMNEQGLATDSKTDKVSNKPVNEYRAPNAGSGPIFGPKPMAKCVPLTMAKPETSLKSNLANEQGSPPRVGMANIRESKPLVHPTSDLNLEKIKKLINEYGAPDNVGGKPLVNSELAPSSCSKYYDVVLSSADFPTTLQPELQIMSRSPNAGHTSPFSLMTSPAPLHKDINYFKSLIKQHGENCESVVDERLQNTNPRGNTPGPGLLKNQKPNQKPCAYFNKPRGCLKGSSCLFLHDVSGQKRSGGMLEAQDSKRMK